MSTRQTLSRIALPSFRFGNPTHCTYCGDPPSGRDHIIPVVYQRDHDRQRFAANGPWTYSCSECNHRLASKLYDSFKERCEAIRDKLDIAAAPIIWGNQELKELDYGLRRMIKARQDRNRWLKDRRWSWVEVLAGFFLFNVV